MTSDTISKVFATLQERKANPKEGSYTSFLLEEGEDEILKKIGEEAIEVIIAASRQNEERLISELADLTYHCLVLLTSRNLSPSDITKELERRHNT